MAVTKMVIYGILFGLKNLTLLSKKLSISCDDGYMGYSDVFLQYKDNKYSNEFPGSQRLFVPGIISCV